MHIRKYEGFILERVGIAQPVLELSSYLTNFLMGQVKSDANESVDDIDFPYEYLKKLYESGKIKYKDFPLDSIRCKLNVKFKRAVRSKLFPNFVFSGYALSPDTDTTKGEETEADEFSSLSASRRVEGTKGINLFISITISIREGYQFKKDPDFRKQMESTLIHELTHAYESHKRGSSKPFKYSMVNVKDRKYKVWNLLTNLIYQCQDYEINAKVAELYPYRKDKNLSKQYSFYMLNLMKEFNSEEFLRKLQNNIMSRDGVSRTKANQKIKELSNDLIDYYVKLSKGFKEEPLEKILELRIKDNKVSSIMKFLKHWERFFKYKSIPFEKKLHKIKSLGND